MVTTTMLGTDESMSSRSIAGKRVEKGRIYVAPPGYHVLLEYGRRVWTDARNARAEGEPAPAGGGPPLPLSGGGVRPAGGGGSAHRRRRRRDRGPPGRKEARRRRGRQDPEDAFFAGMPQSALEQVDEVDYCLPLAKIAPLLARLPYEEVPAEEEGACRTVPEDMEVESKVAGLDPAGAVGSDYQIGQLFQYTCPDCTSPLYEIRDGKLLRYRCRVGHAYTADGVLDEKAEALESALYVALNTLEESAEMSRTLAARAREHRQDHAAARFEARARKAGEQVDLIRHALSDGPPDSAEGLANPRTATLMIRHAFGAWLYRSRVGLDPQRKMDRRPGMDGKSGKEDADPGNCGRAIITREHWISYTYLGAIYPHP